MKLEKNKKHPIFSLQRPSQPGADGSSLNGKFTLVTLSKGENGMTAIKDIQSMKCVKSPTA